MCFSYRFIQYKATSLEKTFKYDLLTEHDLGVTIDLINPDTYKINPDGESGVSFTVSSFLSALRQYTHAKCSDFCTFKNDENFIGKI